MQHCTELEPERIVLAHRAYGGSMVLLDREEDRCSEEHAVFDLQCAESLAIAVNHIGEEASGVERLLMGSPVRGAETTLELVLRGGRIVRRFIEFLKPMKSVEERSPLRREKA